MGNTLRPAANNGAPRPEFLYRRLGVEEATGAYDVPVIQGVPASKPRSTSSSSLSSIDPLHGAEVAPARA